MERKMTLLNATEGYYKYKLLFHKFYLINEIIGKSLSVSEEKFLKMFIEESLNINKIFHPSEMLIWEFWLDLKQKGQGKVNKANKVIKTFPNNYELILANIFKFIEKNEYNENCLAVFFTEAEIFKNHKEHLYLFSALQQSIAYKLGDYSGLYKNYPMQFLSIVKELFNNELFNKKYYNKIVSLIGENWFKFNFRIFFDYFVNNPECLNYTYDNEFKYLIETFDTYKWLDNERRKKLYILANRNIFYQEHCNNLNNELKDKYISKMVEKTFENKSLIV